MIDPDPVKKKPLKGWKVRFVKKFILANPHATIREIALSTQASARTASIARRELYNEGKIQIEDRARNQGPRPKPGPTPDELIDAPEDVEEIIRRDIDRAIAAGVVKVLTRDERRQRLSQYADHPKVPHAAKIAALRELEATEPKADDKALGPGVPLTPEDRIHRVSLMIEALIDIDGVAALDEAYALANKTIPFTPLAYVSKGAPDAGTERPSPPVDAPPAEEDNATPGVHSVVDGLHGEAGGVAPGHDGDAPERREEV